MLNALACFADRRGKCYPGQERLAVASGYSEQTVRLTLRKIEQERWITIESRGPNKTALYTLALHREEHIAEDARLVLGPCPTGLRDFIDSQRTCDPDGPQAPCGADRKHVAPKSTYKTTGRLEVEGRAYARAREPAAKPLAGFCPDLQHPPENKVFKATAQPKK